MLPGIRPGDAAARPRGDRKHRLHINEFAASVAENRPPLTDAVEGVEDIRTVERIVARVRGGSSVSVEGGGGEEPA